jgi:hypothetical protein
MSYNKYHDNDSSNIVSCAVYVLVIAFNLLIGGWSVNYLLAIFLAKVIPFWGAMLIGLFTAEITVPVAAVVWLLKFFGVF